MLLCLCVFALTLKGLGQVHESLGLHLAFSSNPIFLLYYAHTYTVCVWVQKKAPRERQLAKQVISPHIVIYTHRLIAVIIQGYST